MATLPYATDELPGCGGAVKVDPADFRVDELPSYLPSGEGTHLYLHVEKRGLDTRDVLREIGRALRVKERDLGVAGQKDRHAVTTQWISAPERTAEEAARALPAALPADGGAGFRLVEAALHGNKLRTGHLRGNRFRIRIRGVDEAGVARARTIAAALAERGLPHYYGPQRFGRAGDNAEVGRLLLLGADDPRARRAARDHRTRRLLVSAFQSEVFNRVLAARLRDGTWATPRAGDVLEKLASGGLFVCEDPEADAPRVARFECSVTGPLPGGKVRPAPAGATAALEAEALAATGVSPEVLSRSPDAPGARRALRLPVALELVPEDGALVVAFDLPAGGYATVVLRELMKVEPKLDQ